MPLILPELLAYAQWHSRHSGSTKTTRESEASKAPAELFSVSKSAPSAGGRPIAAPKSSAGASPHSSKHLFIVRSVITGERRSCGALLGGHFASTSTWGRSCGRKSSAGASLSRPVFSLVKTPIKMFRAVGRRSCGAFAGRLEPMPTSALSMSSLLRWLVESLQAACRQLAPDPPFRRRRLRLRVRLG